MEFFKFYQMLNFLKLEYDHQIIWDNHAYNLEEYNLNFPRDDCQIVMVMWLK